MFDRLLASISRTADRDRAARPLFISELAGAMQDLTEQEHSSIEESVGIMEKQVNIDDTTRVHLLGYLVLNYGGEDFLEQLAKIYRQRYGTEKTPAPESLQRRA